MFCFRKVSKTLSLVFALGALVAPADAGFQTQTVSLSTTMKPTDFKQSVTIHPFDPSLGSLESVVISFSDVAKIGGTLINASGSTRDFTINEDLKFALSFGGSALLSDDLQAAHTFKSVPNTGPNNTVTFGEYNLGNSVAPTTVLSGPLLTAILGTSDVSFLFQTITNTTIVGGGGNVSYNISTKVNATLTVTYNYINTSAATPEPASLLMTAMGGGLVVGAGYLRKRRSRTASL